MSADFAVNTASEMIALYSSLKDSPKHTPPSNRQHTVSLLLYSSAPGGVNPGVKIMKV